MSQVEIIALLVTILGVASFSAIFTILYSNYAKSYIEEVESGKHDMELMDEYIYNEQPIIKRRKKIMGIVKTIVFYLALIIIIPIFILSMINRFQGNVTMLNKNGMMVVASGSMSKRNSSNGYLDTENLNNQFNTYDIIFIEKVDKVSQLEKYDVIAYIDDNGTNVIHRIIGIEIINGEVRYTTRGDSNNTNDAYKPRFEDVIGVYTDKKIGFVGVFILFFQSYLGIITIISLFYCLIMLDRISQKINNKQNERLDKLDEIIAYKDDIGENDSVTTEFTEVLYYKGYEYHFKDQEFVKKKKIKNVKEKNRK